MKPDRWNRIASLFESALEIEPERRGSFLIQACGQDYRLRRELEGMLARDAEAESRLGGIVCRAAAAGLDAGRRVGPYRLIREIGQGGMGVVYLACRADDQFEQRVAIKLISYGMLSEQARSRFLYERQLLANLSHPYIARLLDGGSTDDNQPFFAMEYVEGRPITVYAEEERLTLDQRLELFCKVCEAVQYAHRNLVVHRDLKPGHILVTTESMPKLLDFGIAKALDPDQWSAATIPILTPDYASPEQVRGAATTTATDVYSLGAVLYELVAGRRPHCFEKHTPGELERVICGEEPTKPSAAAAGAPGSRQRHWMSTRRACALRDDLDNIVLMALRKEPERRYLSVEQFSQDIRRLLDGRPVIAREATVAYRAAKFVRRHRLFLAAAAMVLITLAGGVIAENRQARRAERRFAQVRRLANSFLFDFDEQIQPLPGSTKVREALVRTALEYLDNLAQESGGDRALQFELASAYQKIGDVQGYAMRPNLGQIGPALESHRKALTIARQLAAHDSRPEVQRLLVSAWHRVGYLLRANRQTGPAIEHFRAGLALAERLYAAEPGNPQVSSLLISLAGHLGNTEAMTGDSGAANAHWRRTLEVAQQWAAAYPSERSQSALGQGHLGMVHAFQQMGDLAGAEGHAREAIAIQENLVQRYPDNPAHRRNLLNSYEAMASISRDPALLSLGDSRNAVVYLGKAMAIAKQLAAADPANMTARSDLAIAHDSLCDALVDLNPARAVEECRNCLSVLAAMSIGANLRIQASLPYARALHKLGRSREALQMLREAEAAETRMMAVDPNRMEVRQWLLRIRNQLGELLRDMGDFQAALDAHRQALAIAQELLPSHSSDLLLRRDLADCYEGLGRVYATMAKRRRSAEQVREARDWYRKAMDVWSHWTEWGVSGAFNTRRQESLQKAIADCERTVRAAGP